MCLYITSPSNKQNNNESSNNNVNNDNNINVLREKARPQDYQWLYGFSIQDKNPYVKIGPGPIVDPANDWPRPSFVWFGFVSFLFVSGPAWYRNLVKADGSPHTTKSARQMLRGAMGRDESQQSADHAEKPGAKRKILDSSDSRWADLHTFAIICSIPFNSIRLCQPAWPKKRKPL